MAADSRILLIEDDREIATTLRSVLESAGYKVEWAPNGKEGKRLIEERQPQLVITDMMMPQLGGFPVLEFIRSLEKKPRVIMITANEGGRHKAYAEMLGVDEYLRKPFAMDLFLEAVERALKRGEQAAAEGGNASDAANAKSSPTPPDAEPRSDTNPPDAEPPADPEPRNPLRRPRRKTE